MSVAGSGGDAGTGTGLAGGGSGISGASADGASGQTAGRGGAAGAGSGALGGSSGEPAGRGGIGGAGQGGSGGAGQGGSGGAGSGGALPGLDGHGHLFYSVPANRGDAVVVCTASEPCATPAVCFDVTTEFGICDSAQPIESTECTPPAQMMGPAASPDECGCAGLGCGAGETCISFEQTCSCQPSYHNGCVATACTAPSDCPGSTVCTPSSFIRSPTERCFTPACAADSDCTADGDGRCAFVLDAPLQAGKFRLIGVECVYPGDPTDAGVCADARLAFPDGHICP